MNKKDSLALTARYFFLVYGVGRCSRVLGWKTALHFFAKFTPGEGKCHPIPLQ